MILIVKNEFQIMVADRRVDDEVGAFTRNILCRENIIYVLPFRSPLVFFQ